jgi:hypothetical protein
MMRMMGRRKRRRLMRTTRVVDDMAGMALRRSKDMPAMKDQLHGLTVERGDGASANMTDGGDSKQRTSRTADAVTDSWHTGRH